MHIFRCCGPRQAGQLKIAGGLKIATIYHCHLSIPDSLTNFTCMVNIIKDRERAGLALVRPIWNVVLANTIMAWIRTQRSFRFWIYGGFGAPATAGSKLGEKEILNGNLWEVVLFVDFHPPPPVRYKQPQKAAFAAKGHYISFEFTSYNDNCNGSLSKALFPICATPKTAYLTSNLFSWYIFWK